MCECEGYHTTRKWECGSWGRWETGVPYRQSGARQMSWEMARVLDGVKTGEMSGYMEDGTEGGKFGDS